MATIEKVSSSEVAKVGMFEKVKMSERKVTSGPCLGTDSLGPCIALAAFGTHKTKGAPLMGLWHADGVQIGGFGEVLDLPVDTGIGVVLDFKKFLISEGMSEEGMKIHVIGGVDDDDHKYFEALWEMKESYPDVWKELGKFVVPFQKIKDDPTCSTEVYLKHPKTILVSFFSLAEYTPSNT